MAGNYTFHTGASLCRCGGQVCAEGGRRCGTNVLQRKRLHLRIGHLSPGILLGMVWTDGVAEVVCSRVVQLDRRRLPHTCSITTPASPALTPTQRQLPPASQEALCPSRD
ncbi:hypothetical protein E2C01_058477 [Portunus trituberculatus]|uniref:Uncharacterized protein n=1 Tax=Portunus trituberculatus TaxID=210409 RepID=A0A5B7H2R8_PORTR|nr:hypothetical protein [Portunus trituberculatus]